MGKFIVKETKTGFVFHLKANNGETIATSEVYSSKENCVNGIESLKKNAPVAPIEDQTVEGYQKLGHPKFEVYEDKMSQYRFRVKASNGQIIAVSEAYIAKASCLHGVETVKNNAPDAPIEE